VNVQRGDAAVVRASVEDPEQFEVVFDRHHGRIWAYLARLGGRQCADDLASEVFLAAFARRDRYDPARGSVASWLYGIASNLARTWFRSHARAARAFARSATPDVVLDAALDTIDDALTSREQFERVREALERLSVTDREVIVLFAWQHLSYQDIARVLDVEVGTVRSRLARARARLRELAGLNGELTDARTASTRTTADG